MRESREREKVEREREKVGGERIDHSYNHPSLMCPFFS